MLKSDKATCMVYVVLFVKGGLTLMRIKYLMLQTSTVTATDQGNRKEFDLYYFYHSGIDSDN